MVHSHSSTASQRVHIVSQLLAHAGTYGEISQMSRSRRVSRQTLYAWKQKGQRALEAAFDPPKPQARAAKPVDLQRAVLTLLVEGHASYRGIQTCLAVLLGQHVSLGTITAIVQTAGERAQAWLEQQVSEQGRVLALDEQYSSKRGEAYLNVVDVHSGQVWASLPPVAVDGESWTLALWYLQAQGVVCTGTVSDGGKAIAEALRTTQALKTHQRDVWHLLHLAAQVQARLFRLVQDEEERGRLIEQQEQHQAAMGKKPVGRPAKTTASEQEQRLIQLHRVFDAVRYLFTQLRDLLEIVVISQESTPRLLDCQARRDEVETLLALLEEVGQSAPTLVQKEVQRVAKQVRLALPALLHFAEELESAQQEAIALLGAAAVGLIAWAWQRRALLGKQPQHLLAGLHPTWRVAAGRLLLLWNGAVRASSAVENWHSIVRPHLAVHRSLSAGMLALLAVRHNHRVAPRGLHEGLSPLQRGGVAVQADDWLVALGYPPDPWLPHPATPPAQEELVA